MARSGAGFPPKFTRADAVLFPELVGNEQPEYALEKFFYRQQCAWAGIMSVVRRVAMNV